jgi:hypothetical protein
MNIQIIDNIDNKLFEMSIIFNIEYLKLLNYKKRNKLEKNY